MKKTWSWVHGGIALGLLSIFAVLVAKPLGVSTEYVITNGIVIKNFFPRFIVVNPYFEKYADDLNIGYGIMVVIGLFVGAAVSKYTGGIKVEGKEKTVPRLWEKNFGEKPMIRLIHAFVGGILLIFGARLADGCTSGHVISGMSQLSLSGFVFAIAVFAAGIPTSLFLFRNYKEDTK